MVGLGRWGLEEGSGGTKDDGSSGCMEIAARDGERDVCMYI